MTKNLVTSNFCLHGSLQEKECLKQTLWQTLELETSKVKFHYFDKFLITCISGSIGLQLKFVNMKFGHSHQLDAPIASLFENFGLEFGFTITCLLQLCYNLRRWSKFWWNLGSMLLWYFDSATGSNLERWNFAFASQGCFHCSPIQDFEGEIWHLHLLNALNVLHIETLKVKFDFCNTCMLWLLARMSLWRLKSQFAWLWCFECIAVRHFKGEVELVHHFNAVIVLQFQSFRVHFEICFSNSSQLCHRSRL